MARYDFFYTKIAAVDTASYDFQLMEFPSGKTYDTVIGACTDISASTFANTRIAMVNVTGNRRAGTVPSTTPPGVYEVAVVQRALPATAVVGDTVVAVVNVEKKQNGCVRVIDSFYD